MPTQKQLALIIEETVEVSTNDKCKQLCDKCDVVIRKIKENKSKKVNKTTEKK